MAMMLGLWVPPARAQWTITFSVDEQQAGAVLGPERVGPMQAALGRAKSKLEQIFAGSTGSVLVTVDWSAPTAPGAAADAVASQLHAASVTVARDKFINQATADNEPQSEILLYESLPTGAVPFRFDSATVLSATALVIPNSLNKHLGFRPVTNQNDGTIRFRPEAPQLKWQFWPRVTNNSVGREIFEAAAIHESLHLMGFVSSADLTSPPSSLYSWDLFRFGDTSIPVGANVFGTLPRELRPTEEATGITALGSATNAYKLSRGLRTGGDGFQASHWRSFSRLNPPTAIGVMDPGASIQVHENLQKRLYTRADVEAMDVMGWNVNPDAVSYANTGSIQLLAPDTGAQIAAGQPITFEWEPTTFLALTLQIHVANSDDDNPVRYFSDMPGGTTSVTLPGADSMPPGDYAWALVGHTAAGYQDSEVRQLTILPACDPDYTQDGNVNQDDVACLVALIGGDPTCSALDPDFNQDGNPDQDDIAALVGVVAGGPCP